MVSLNIHASLREGSFDLAVEFTISSESFHEPPRITLSFPFFGPRGSLEGEFL
jgi:hypothetical protein